MYLIVPVYDPGALSMPLPCSESAWNASTATAWREVVRSEVSQDDNGTESLSSKAFADLSGMILHQPESAGELLRKVRENALASSFLLGSIFGAVLGSKKVKPRILTLQATELRPLEDALKASYDLLPPLGHPDPLFTGVIWNAAWLHLLSNMRFVEIACVSSS